MFSFDSETIYKAWRNLNSLDAKVGGMFCILSCINEEIVPNKSYKIDGLKLRQQLSYVFDKEYKINFSTQQANYIIFAKNWFVTFFENEIRNRIDLLSCAVFFLRRHNFENPAKSDDIINNFLNSYHLLKYKNIWFSTNSELNINYTNKDVEENQNDFYSHLPTSSFFSLTFNNTLQKYAYDLSAAGHIQTLYSAKGILKTCIFSTEPLDLYYVMKNTDENINRESNTKYATKFPQIIYYGVPGSGKSHKIDEETKALPDEQKMRVVFHPEYTNADFVGQILPVMEEGSGVRYAFKPGAFTKILVKALKNPAKSYCLIIEEINRGNAAAIFGEIFQLLDRGNDGWSSYCIMNDDINYEIRKSVPELNWTENTGIRLPPNLSLLATMNTSDQNVFTLDNAFQRRWDMQLVKNECTNENQMEATITVKDQKITWGDFQQTINSVIGEKSNEGGLSSMEDKRLGCWFVKAEDKEIKADVFANKVLKYLWDDAFKFYHQEIFGTEIKNFEELQKSFFEKGFAVFSDACGLKIEKTSDGQAELDSASENIDSETSSE